MSTGKLGASMRFTTGGSTSASGDCSVWTDRQNEVVNAEDQHSSKTSSGGVNLNWS